MAGQHIQRHRERLLGRSDHRNGVPWMLFRTRAALAAHRVVWRDIARRPCAVMLDCTAFAHALPLNTCYVAAFPDRESALAATVILNSTWAAALATVAADEARGGYRRINARIVGIMPLTTSNETRGLVDLCVQAHRSRNVSQHDLDDAVAKALALPGPVQERLRSLVPPHR